MKKVWKTLSICMLGALLCACQADDATDQNGIQQGSTEIESNSEPKTQQITESKTEPESKTELETKTESESKTEVTTQKESQSVSEETTNSKPTYTYTDLNKTMYATASVNMRSGPNTDFDKAGALSLLEELVITGVCNETGWYRGEYKGNTVYVSSKYLSETKPDLPTYITYHDTGDPTLNAKCDAVLNEIADTSMTEREIAYAIYKWAQTNIVYQGVTDGTSWIDAANTALSTKKGNCIAFYSVARALLTRAGFENTMATSYSKDHYWNMVKVEGSWWHFDCTAGWKGERFLWTTKQINEYRVVWPSGYVTEYHFNPEGCPETP